MKTASAKAKGRNLQQWTRDLILSIFSEELEDGDCRSVSMGVSGSDLLFSPKARQLLGIDVECKSRSSIAVYGYYEQAKTNSGGYEPICVIKQNRSKPLVVVDAEYFFKLLKGANNDTTI